MDDIEKKVVAIMQSLPQVEENPIDYDKNPIPPFKGNGDVKLIIIGQDPTIRNIKSRDDIRCTLNLDKPGSLKTYIERIVAGLGLSFDNVYATNIFKYFYTVPPQDTFSVLEQHVLPNLELLKAEINEYPNAIIITLGEPVLKLLTKQNNKVRKHWNYKDCGFHHVLAKDNKLGRDFYPFIHISSYCKHFYKDNFQRYIQYVIDTESGKPNMNK